MKLLAASLVFISAMSTAAGQSIVDDSFPSDAGVAIEVVHKAVSADFLDPESAQYKRIILRNKAYKPAICGLVNAKNSMGGYTPFYPFAYAVESGSAVVADNYQDELVGSMVVTTLEIMGCPLSALGL